jgi:hypothetical protein
MYEWSPKYLKAKYYNSLGDQYNQGLKGIDTIV